MSLKNIYVSILLQFIIFIQSDVKNNCANNMNGSFLLSISSNYIKDIFFVEVDHCKMYYVKI